MARFIILMHDPVALQKKMRDSSPEVIAAVVGKYMAWAGKMASAGKMRGGEKLKLDGGRVLKGNAGSVKTTSGAYRADEAALGGYFIIEADSYEQAAELCRDNPQLDEGGLIEIRELAEMKAGP